MSPQEIQELLQTELAVQEVHVQADGSHYQVIVVSEQFADMSRVKQQQFVYGPLNEHIKSGALHAVTIKAYTPDQWERQKKLVMPGA